MWHKHRFKKEVMTQSLLGKRPYVTGRKCSKCGIEWEGSAVADYLQRCSDEWQVAKAHRHRSLMHMLFWLYLRYIVR